MIEILLCGVVPKRKSSDQGENKGSMLAVVLLALSQTM